MDPGEPILTRRPHQLPPEHRPSVDPQGPDASLELGPERAVPCDIETDFRNQGYEASDGVHQVVAPSSVPSRPRNPTVNGPVGHGGGAARIASGTSMNEG